MRPSCRAAATPHSSVDGHFLYGAPASGLELTGDVTIAAAKERAGFPGYAFGLADDDVTAVRQDLDDLPQTDAQGKANFTGRARQAAGEFAPARSQDHRKHGGIRRAWRRAHADASGRRRRRDDRRQAGVLRPLARRRRQCRFRRGHGRARRQARGEKRLALFAAQDRDQLPVVPAERRMEFRAGQAHRQKLPTARSMQMPTSRRGCRCR